MSRRAVPPLTERERVALRGLAIVERVSVAGLQREIVRDRLTDELRDNDGLRQMVDAVMRYRETRRDRSNVIELRRRRTT